MRSGAGVLAHVLELRGVLGEHGVVDVDYLHRVVAEELLRVGQGAGGPAGEDVVAAGALRGGDDDVGEQGVGRAAGADVQDEVTAVGDFLDDFGGAAEMGEGYVEVDDVDAVADAGDVAAIAGVPEGGMVAEVGLRCEEEG